MLRSFWFALALVACGTADDTDDTDVVDTDVVDTDVADTDTEPTYADVQAIFTTKCSGCHGESGGLTLSGDWHAHTVGVAAGQLATMSRIEPGDPETSYLVLKLRGTHTDAGGMGVKMPMGGSVTADQLADVEAWITAGAKK